MERAERTALARQVAKVVDEKLVAHMKVYREEKALHPAQRDPARIEREAWVVGYLSAMGDILKAVEES